VNTISRYLKKWHLTEARLIAETRTSLVYLVRHRGLPAVLKVLSELGRRDEAAGEIALRFFDGQGAVRLLDADEGAHLLSHADGPPLKSVVTDGRDGLASQVVCQVLGHLHKKPFQNLPGLKTVAENFRALFENAEKSGADPMIIEGAKMSEELLASAAESEKVVLHGDLHHKNILHSSTQGWLAIDPKGLIGERTYDLANIFYNPDDTPEITESPSRILSMSQTFSGCFGIDPIRVLKFAFAFGCLSACWAKEDGLDPTRRLRIARMIQSLLP
jgi:streptomycin 6-kinase